MKIKRVGVAAIALAAAGALVLTGCTSGSPESTEGAGSGGIVTASSVEPQNPLVPGNTNENGGGRILEAIFAGLLAYDAEGQPHNDVAESIETEDSQHYTIKIREGLEFSNGEPVTASSFVDAWNYASDTANEQLQQYFFESIEGFSYDESVPELPGLEVVDDTTFNVTLKQPESDFPLRLGYAAYYPLPESAFEDIEAFGQNPVGNGPYMLDGEDAWKHNERIDLVPNPSYDGYKEVQNGGLSFIFYATPEAAYADLQGGNLDVIDEVPTGALGTFQSEFEGRTVQQASAGIQTFTIPERLAHFSGEEGKLRRAAISKAIDREEITDVIFEGARVPAKDFTAPPIDGWSDSIPGAEVLEFDPEGAKELWAQADAIAPWSGTFQVAYNADGGHQPWVDALANQLKNNLGIDASGAPYPTFAEVRTAVTDRTIQTAFRSGWIGDYPALFNFLGPLYATNASSNDGDYSNPEVDALLKEGLAATDIETANEKFQQAQEILFVDLPAIPLWYYGVDGAWSESVDNVQYGWNTNVLYYAVTKGE